MQLFHRDDSEAVILIDADNAFNRLNRSVALWNIKFICPALSLYAENCYNSPSRLFVAGGAEISSEEGTTQGDPLAMPFYALSLMPLVRELSGAIQQIWYADDAQATGSLKILREWWNLLVLRGPGYGYFVNASKTILVFKPDKKDAAAQTFDGTGIKFSEGARDLGGVIGASGFIENYVTNKISEFCKDIELLSQVAETSPQAAHAAYVHGMRHRWRFLQRTVPDVSTAFEPLETVIKQRFIPALLGAVL